MNARADWRTTLATLTPAFAQRAAQQDEGDEFVAQNYDELRASGLLAAGVPKELGEVVKRLGEWGARWTAPVQRERLDARLLTWDMRRRFDLERLPEKRVVVRFGPQKTLAARYALGLEI